MSKIGVTCHVIGKGRSGEDLSLWVHRKEGGKVYLTLGPVQDHAITVSVDDLKEAVFLCDVRFEESGV